MKCPYCGKARCVHGSPEDVEMKMGVQPATVVEQRKPKAGDSLFQLVGLRDLECVLCRWTAPPSPYQPALRMQHGLIHVKAGQAVAIRRGLPEGSTRFEIV